MRRVLCGDWHQPELCHGDGVVEGLVSDRPGDSDGEGEKPMARSEWAGRDCWEWPCTLSSQKADSNIGMSTPWSFALPNPWPCAMRLLLACTTRPADCVKGSNACLRPPERPQSPQQYESSADGRCLTSKWCLAARRCYDLYAPDLRP